MEERYYIDRLMTRYPVLRAIEKEILAACELLALTYREKRMLFTAGNGGSAADADHIVGELMKGFKKKRSLSQEEKHLFCRIGEEGERAGLAGAAQMAGSLADCLQGALPALCLDGNRALSTAFGNDVDPNMVYAQQIFGYGSPGDVFLAISTSGNAKNLLYGALAAKARGMKVILLGGGDGGGLRPLSDIALIVPLKDTPDIQELHLPIYHALCLELEKAFFGGE